MEVNMAEPVKRCKFCMEVIHAQAIKCKHCGSMLTDEDPNNIKFEIDLEKSGVQFEVKPCNITKWNRFSDRYIEFLNINLDNNSIGCSGEYIEGVNVKELIESGAIIGHFFKNGKIVGITDHDSLISSGNYDDFVRCLATKVKYRDSYYYNYLFVHFIDGKIHESRDESIQSHNRGSSITPSIFLSGVIGDLDAAYDLLSKDIDSYWTELPHRRNHDEIHSAQKILCTFLNRDNEAKQILNRIEAEAKTCRDFILASRSNIEIFNNHSKASKFIENSIELAEDISDLNQCAELSCTHLDNLQLAHKCIKKAESISNDSSSWRECARFWMINLSKHNESKQCLMKAEELSTDFDDYLYCADVYYNYFNDKNKWRSMIKQSIPLAETYYNWTSLARAYIDIGDRRECYRCLKMAEEKADTDYFKGSSLIICATNFKEMLDDEKETIRILLKIEASTVIQDTSELSLKELFNSGIDHNNLANLMMSNMTAESDLISCAQAWKDVLNNDSEALRCMELAEERAGKGLVAGMGGNASGYCTCAEGWINTFNDTRKAEKCIEKAMQCANDTSSWISCARLWKDLFHNIKESEYCIEKADFVASNDEEYEEVKNAKISILN